MDNRRRAPRFAIELDALVHPPQGRSWVCAIRDFCDSGMLLMTSGSSRTLDATGARCKSGDAVDIHYSLRQEGSEQHFRLRAVVARVLDTGNGMGVQFPDGLPKDAKRALEALTDLDLVLPEGTSAEPKREGRDKRISEEGEQKVRAGMRSLMQRALGRIAQGYFERVDQALLVLARDAVTNQAQTTYLEALNQMESKQEELAGAFVSRVLEQIDTVQNLDDVLEQVQKKEQEGRTIDRLALVDTDQFEDWLAVAEIVTKAEGAYGTVLHDIRLRLQLIAEAWGHKEVCPVSPAVIARAFDDALDRMVVERPVRQHLYRNFQKVVLPALRSLYTALNKLLEESGEFPPLEEIEEREKKPKVRKDPDKTSGSATGDHSDAPDAAAGGAAAGAASAAAGAAAGAPPGADGVPPGLPGAGTAPGVAGIAAGMMAGGAPGMVNMGGGATGGMPGMGAGMAAGPMGMHNTYATAKELLHLQRAAGGAEAGVLSGGVPVAASPAEAFQADEILGALQQLQQRLGDQPLQQRPFKRVLLNHLRESTGDTVRAFTASEIDALDVVEGLVSSIQQDTLVTPGVKDWVRRLEITLNKLATQDKEFLDAESDEPHPAVQVLNQLARLGNAADEDQGIDREVGSRVDQLMNRIINEFDRNPEIFKVAEKELNPLVERQGRAYKSNFDRTVRGAEGQQKLIRARRAVITEVARRVEGRMVPEAVLKLLKPAWRNLLVHTHLRHGSDSDAWRSALAVIEQLVDQMTGEVGPNHEHWVEPDALLDGVRRGLDIISYEPGLRQPLERHLHDALVSGEAIVEVDVEPGTTASLLGLDEALPEPEPEPKSEDETERVQWQEWLERARKLEVGDWLAINDEQGRPRIVTLAFVGEEHESFVLVNRKGIKVRELSLRDTTDLLADGTLSILDEFDLPLMERASNRMLQNMHNKLSWHASHDELTGLINRREFERQVDQAVMAARGSETSHVLMILDLDQFKVINTTSGHEAGDELLKTLAPKLKHQLAGKKHTLARLGGDEFGILLHKTDLDDGVELAQGVLVELSAERFVWKERSYSLSASIGLLGMDATADSAGELLQHAESAVYAAKDAGRNRVQLYEAEDAGLMRRAGVMEWVSAIDKALDEDRLLLNCQPIVPVQANDTSAHHYEILLSMVDENGDVMPPAEFIYAAETYNRMNQIDRWVIRNTFAWMRTNRKLLDDIGGFSINISGHSLNDDTFADYVLRKFSELQVPTGKVTFEITETAAIGNLDNAVDFMNRMKIIGCQFSLDDFGSGMSSYSYLRNLPVDFVKIDGVFVRDLQNSPGDYAVVKSINEIGHFMGKRTVAEYVENHEILEQLRIIGVDYAQGYGVGRPMPLRDLPRVFAAA